MHFLFSRLSWLAACTIYLLSYILVLFSLKWNLKYATAVVSFNLGMPSFQHFLWKWKRTVSFVDCVLYLKHREPTSKGYPKRRGFQKEKKKQKRSAICWRAGFLYCLRLEGIFLLLAFEDKRGEGRETVSAWDWGEIYAVEEGNNSGASARNWNHRVEPRKERTFVACWLAAPGKCVCLRVLDTLM